VRSPLEPLFVLDTLGLRPQALGLLGGAWGLGMVLGAAAAPAAARRWSRARLLAVGIVAVGASALGASQASALSSLLALWLLSGAGNALGTVCYESLLQEFTPDSVRGRVLSASEAVLNAAFLAGASLSGWLAAGAGVRAAFAVSGAVFLVAASASLVLLNEPAKGAAVARGAGTVPSAP
jgi:MFS family permease